MCALCCEPFMRVHWVIWYCQASRKKVVQFQTYWTSGYDPVMLFYHIARNYWGRIWKLSRILQFCGSSPRKIWGCSTLCMVRQKRAICKSFLHVFYQLAKVVVFSHKSFPLYSVTSSRCRNLHDVFLILTAVDCGPLIDPANGQVDHTAGTTFKQTATYSCNTGYGLVGNSTSTCQATGNWSGSEPICQGMLLHSVNLWSLCERPLSDGANWWCQASGIKRWDWSQTNCTGNYGFVMLISPLVHVKIYIPHLDSWLWNFDWSRQWPGY